MKKTFLLIVLLLGLFGTPKSSAQIEPYVGQIIAVGFNFVPQGWAQCNGQLLSIAQNTALFSLLGTQYGGNGTTNFALPDLRGRAMVGEGQGPGLASVLIGEQGGNASTTITMANMPAHNHPINASILAGTISNPTNAVPANTSAFDKEYSATANQVMSQTGVTGSSQPVSTMQPYLGLNYIIALQGVFPPRP